MKQLLSKLSNIVGINTDHGALHLQDLHAQLNAINKVLSVIEFAPDGTIIKANQNFLDVMGYAENEVVGQHHRMFVEPTLATGHVYQQFWSKLAQGKFDQGQYKRIAKGGREVWLESSYNPIFDLNNKVYKVVKYATDITQGKMKEADTNGQLNAINKVLSVIEFAPDGTIIKANQNFLDVMGYAEDEVLGQHHCMFVEPAFAKSHVYQQFWSKLAQGEFDQGQYRRIAKGGREVWLESSYNPIFDLNNKVYKVVKYATDITQAYENAIIANTLSLVANETDNSVLISDEKGLIEYVNAGFTRLTGYTLDEVRGKKPGDFLQGPLTDKATIKRLSENIKAHRPFYDEILNYNKNGEAYWISIVVNPVFNAKGVLDKFVAIQTNINQSKLQTIDFNIRLEAISRSIAIIEFTPQGHILFANENFCTTMGYALDEILGQHHRMFVEASYANSAEYKAFWDRLGNGQFDSASYKRTTKNGEMKILQASYNPILDHEGKVTKVVKFASDITAQKKAEEEILRLTMSDPLTGLSNRRHLTLALKDEWRRAMRNNNPISLLMIDIDYFKRFNDTYGHVAGDECLVKVAAVIAQYARRVGDLAARFGGEEFVLLLPNTAADQAIRIAEEMRLQVGLLDLKGIATQTVTMSGGIATLIPTTDISEIALISQADKALYLSKTNGRNRITCDNSNVF